MYIQNTSEARMLMIAHGGATSGELMYAIWLQSKVRGSRPIPLFMPKTWLTTAFFGTIQQMKVKYPSAGKMKSGNQYQTKEMLNAIMKKV